MFPSGRAVPVTFDQTSFTAVIPLAEIGGDNSFNFAMVLGTFAEPTDCAPNGGSIHSPDGSIVPIVPLTITASIDPIDSVVASTGAVTISGTVTCSKPANARMAGSVRQRAGRATITGRFFIDRFACDGETPWVADVVGDNGIFKGGAADVSVEAVGVTNIEFVFADASATVRLNGSRHLRGAMVPGLGDPTGLGGSGVLASLVIVGIVLGFVRRRRSGGRREP